MQSLTISLPDALMEYVEDQVLAGSYSSASDYVLALIRADQKCKAEEVLEARLLKGLNTAETELTPADWNAIRKAALAEMKERQKAR